MARLGPAVSSVPVSLGPAVDPFLGSEQGRLSACPAVAVSLNPDFGERGSVHLSLMLKRQTKVNSNLFFCWSELGAQLGAWAILGTTLAGPSAQEKLYFIAFLCDNRSQNRINTGEKAHLRVR